MTTRLLLLLSAAIKFVYAALLLWAQRDLVTANTAVAVLGLGWRHAIAVYIVTGIMAWVGVTGARCFRVTSALLLPNFILGCIGVGTIAVAMARGVYPDGTRVTPEHICMDQLVPLIWGLCVIKCTIEWVNKTRTQQ